jgi:hypothetical protein
VFVRHRATKSRAGCVKKGRGLLEDGGTWIVWRENYRRGMVLEGDREVAAVMTENLVGGATAAGTQSPAVASGWKDMCRCAVQGSSRCPLLTCFGWA